MTQLSWVRPADGRRADRSPKIKRGALAGAAFLITVYVGMVVLVGRALSTIEPNALAPFVS